MYLPADFIWLAINKAKNERMVTAISGRGLDQFSPVAALLFYALAPFLIHTLAVERVLVETAVQGRDRCDYMLCYAK
jgi:hypothetical protein